MYRAFAQPASSSTSRSTNTEHHDDTQQPLTIPKRQARYETPVSLKYTSEPTEPPSISTRRGITNQPGLSLPQQSGNPQLPSSGLKSPAYLQGKNPYDQVLDKVEHRYREPRTAVTTDGPPSQARSCIEGRPRTSGSFQFNTRPTPPEPERAVPTSDSPLLPVLPRRPPKPVSVQATRNFFESKASQYQSILPLPPWAATIANGASGKSQAQDRQTTVPSQHPYAPESSPVRTSERNEADHALQPPRVSTNSNQVDSSQRMKPVAQPKTSPSGSNVIIENTNLSRKLAIPKGLETSVDVDQDAIGRRRPVAHDESKPTKQGGTSRETDPQFQKHPMPVLKAGVRNLVGKFEDFSKHRSSPSASLIERDITGDSGWRTVRKGTKRSSAIDLHRDHNASQIISSKPVDVGGRSGDLASQSLSHDGSSSDPSPSRRSTASSQVLIADVGMQAEYHSIEVPDHVDWRAAYGRRTSQDFGFPGARIKPRRTFWGHPPLHDPGNWTRRACGQISHMRKGENGDTASRKNPRQCSSKAPSLKAKREWQSLCSSGTTDAVEEFDIEPSGQLKPNINDSPAILEQHIKSAPQLIDVINSTADDLGLKLDRRPTAKDDEIFRKAPVESAPQASAPLLRSDSLTLLDGKFGKGKSFQQTGRYLTNLSEARTQVTNEPDSIAKFESVTTTDEGDIDPPLQRTTRQQFEETPMPSAPRVDRRVPPRSWRKPTLSREEAFHKPTFSGLAKIWQGSVEPCSSGFSPSKPFTQNEYQGPVVLPTTIDQPTRQPKTLQDEPDFEALVNSATYLKEYVNDKPKLLHPTRTAGQSRLPTPESEQDKAEPVFRTQLPRHIMRKAINPDLISPELVGERARIQQVTVRLPSPEEILRRGTAQSHAQPPRVPIAQPTALSIHNSLVLPVESIRRPTSIHEHPREHLEDLPVEQDMKFNILELVSTREANLRPREDSIETEPDRKLQEHVGLDPTVMQQTMEVKSGKQPFLEPQACSTPSSSISQLSPILNPGAMIYRPNNLERKEAAMEIQATRPAVPAPNPSPQAPQMRGTTSVPRESATFLMPEELDSLQSSSRYSSPAPEHNLQANFTPPRRASPMRITTDSTGFTTSPSEPQEFTSMEEIQYRAASRRAVLEELT
ncbi:Nn.00g038550.m01.CDS01 [Neocucurbitaria sp. VM-36]